MPRFRFRVINPQGQRQPLDVEGENPDDIMNYLHGQGYFPEGFRQLGEEESPETTPITPPPAIPPTMGTPLTSPPFSERSIPGLGTPADIMQTAVPLLAALATRNPGLAGLGGAGALTARGILPKLGQFAARAGPSAALGLGARAATGAVLPSSTESTAGGRAGREVVRGLPSELMALLPGGQAGMLGRDLLKGSPLLAPLRRFSSAVGLERGEQLLGAEAERGVQRMTAGAAATLRQLFGPIFREEKRGSQSLLGSVRSLVRSVGKDSGLRDKALLAAFNDTKIQLDKLDTATAQKLIRNDPASLMKAIQIYASKGGDQKAVERIRATLVQSRMSSAFREALETPPYTPYPGAFENDKILNPGKFLKLVRAFRKDLGAEESFAFGGKGGVQELDKLSQMLGEGSMARELAYAERRAQRVEEGSVQPFRERPPKGLEKVTSYLRLRPFGRAFALGAGELLGGARGAMEGYLAEESIAAMLGHFAGTELGLRWIAAGLEMQRRGVPEQMIVPTLARMLPNALASLDVINREQITGAALGTAYESLQGLRDVKRVGMRSLREELAPGGDQP